MKSACVLLLSLISVHSATAFVPALQSLISKGCSLRSRINLLGLRCSDESSAQEPKYVKLGTTKTSWQGWGSTTVRKEEMKIPVDSANPEASIKEALLKARESEAISKYLGGTESKTRAGITGDVEYVSFVGGTVTLRLTGNFWHNRQARLEVEVSAAAAKLLQ